MCPTLCNCSTNLNARATLLAPCAGPYPLVPQVQPTSTSPTDPVTHQPLENPLLTVIRMSPPPENPILTVIGTSPSSCDLLSCAWTEPAPRFHCTRGLVTRCARSGSLCSPIW